MAKQPVKKKTVNFDWLNNIKEECKENLALKPVEFIELPSGFYSATHLAGIPMGQLTLCAGHSNTGKSSMLNAVIVGCQKKGILPVIIDTENNFSFEYAKAFGMEAEPIWGKRVDEVINTETGEVTEVEKDAIIRWDGFFAYFNHASLLKKYGKKDYATGKDTSKSRTVPCIEDVCACIKDFLDAQDRGDLNVPLCFLWDSVGSVRSFDSLNSSSQQNMRDANRIKEAFSTIIPRITATRIKSAPFQNTMFAVNKVWVNNTAMLPSLQLANGEGLKYYSRFVIQLGGITGPSIKKLEATYKGQKYQFGIETKVEITKNHLDSPHNIQLKGTFLCLPDSIYPVDSLDDWKKTHSKYIADCLKSGMVAEGGSENEVVNESEIGYTEELQETEG